MDGLVALLFASFICLCMFAHVFLQGAVPFFVNATAGTTVLGAFDPIDEIADICEKHNLWLHVDVSSSTGLLPQVSTASHIIIVVFLFSSGMLGWRRSCVKEAQALVKRHP